MISWSFVRKRTIKKKLSSGTGQLIRRKHWSSWGRLLPLTQPTPGITASFDLFSGSLAVQVAVDPEGTEQKSQGKQVEDVDPKSHGLPTAADAELKVLEVGGRVSVRNKQMKKRQRATKHKLADLKRGQARLQELWNLDLEN